MTKQTRRKFTTGFKAKVALEAIKDQKTLAELILHFDVNPVCYNFQMESRVLSEHVDCFRRKHNSEI